VNGEAMHKFNLQINKVEKDVEGRRESVMS